MNILHSNQDHIFKSIIENAVDGIILINSFGIILAINKAASQLFEISDEDALGKNVSILMPEPYSGLHDSFLQKYLETKIGKIIGKGREVFAKTKSGKIIPVFLSISEITTNHGTLFCGMLQDITARKKTEEELALLSNKIIAIQEEERDRISQEIHDDLGTSLSLLKLMLQSTFALVEKSNPKTEDFETVRNKFNDSISYLGNIADTAREISHNLSPVAYKNLGLEHAIEKLSERAFSKKQYEVFLDIKAIHGFFNDNWNIHLYRVFQEAFTNILKHARAKKIKVSSEKKIDDKGNSLLKIVIADDGIGFHYDSLVKNEMRGLGLSIMKKRIQDAKGQFSVVSKPGQGTVLTIEITN